MPLYKFVPTPEIAQQVARGVFRFYELTKYIKMEEETGRSDPSEGSMTFTDGEIRNSSEALPRASFNGIEFSCSKISPDEDYLSQYFVFCVSTQKSEIAIEGCKYSVELNTDMFDVFEMLLPTPTAPSGNHDGLKFFSHAPVEYYDVNNHPARMDGEVWKEAYIKRREFSYQCEYRAALFMSDQFFAKAGSRTLVYRAPARDSSGNLLDLKLLIQSGIDEAGWRFLELDISEFQSTILTEPPEFETLID
ncbi:MAG: hypothetical protein ABJH63_20180 [Rhizobiaceae bacterium]